MRGRSGEWGAPPWGGRRGPARHIGAGIFGFLFFLFVMSAIVGGLIAWVLAPGRGWFLLVGFVVIVAFAGMMRGLFRRTWAPISALIDATTRLGDGDTSVRMADSRGPWYAVSSAFNKMADRLEAEDERRRRLLADLGHELRTPLTVIRGEIEAVIDAVHSPTNLVNVVDEVELMERLLEDLRTLALAEAGGLELVMETTDLGELVSDVAASSPQCRKLRTSQCASMSIVPPTPTSTLIAPTRWSETSSPTLWLKCGTEASSTSS